MSHRQVCAPATLGVLGGGQLGRYTVMAAATMGYRTIVLDPDPSAPAGAMAHEHLVAAYDDPASLRRLAFDCDVVTTEFENPPATALDELAATVVVAPSPDSVRIAQDRIAEKAFLVDNGFPVGAVHRAGRRRRTADRAIARGWWCRRQDGASRLRRQGATIGRPVSRRRWRRGRNWEECRVWSNGVSTCRPS